MPQPRKKKTPDRIDGAGKRRKTKPSEYPTGRPKTVIDYDEVREMAATGMGLTHIAANVGLSVSHFSLRRREEPELEEALAKGRSEGVRSVAAALKHTAEEGNVVAQRFYLINHDPDSWKEKQTVEVEGSGLADAIKQGQERARRGKE